MSEQTSLSKLSMITEKRSENTSMNTSVRKAASESCIDTLQSLVERVELFINAENGFSHKTQFEKVEKCSDLLKSLLLQTNSSNTNECVSDHKENKENERIVAQAWIDGKSKHLEKALQSKTDEERQVIEERAIEILKQQIPKYAWQHHQRDLAARVQKRMEKQLQNTKLLHLPTDVRTHLNNFKTFIRGDKYKHLKYHEFSWGEKVSVMKGKNKNIYGFVCHETSEYLFILDEKGKKFRKKKTNVKIVCKRELIIERKLRVLRS